MALICLHCEKALPLAGRSDRKWCSERCKSNHKYIRKEPSTVCSRCGVRPPSGGPRAKYCIECRTEARTENWKSYYDRNREKVIAASAAHQKLNWAEEQVHARRRRLKREYGIAPEQYDAMLEAQDGHCAICPATEPGRGEKHFIVDHDHTTGEVRGLLCHRCNTGIGMLGESAERCVAAAIYLKRPPAREALYATTT